MRKRNKVRMIYHASHKLDCHGYLSPHDFYDEQGDEQSRELCSCSPQDLDIVPSESKSAPVDLDYNSGGVENVYLTGGALWPTGASWNPTCVMTCLAMNLVDKLTNENN